MYVITYLKVLFYNTDSGKEGVRLTLSKDEFEAACEQYGVKKGKCVDVTYDGHDDGGKWV